MFHIGYMIASICGIIFFPKTVSARFCEGGHICSLPRECCTQGCCPPYQTGPRQLPPATDHVLNLFFINHWYFWCLVVALVLAIFCAYSLWKKRRTLCGWGFSEHHTHSEGDSAGSCYAPPQYSRCNSFHHPPPPYTEVTSKPDLYPLVFTCNSDNGKNGASYLMVQYFRNYIVRPAGGSLSATSTVDSLSSSFICNANESNTLVPPPYSRAASPDGMGVAQHFMIPRSASQLVCSQPTESAPSRLMMTQSHQYHHHQPPHSGSGNTESMPEAVGVYQTHGPTPQQLRTSESVQFQMDTSCGGGGRPNAFMSSQSDQQFRYMANSNSSLSDIFANADGHTAQNNNYNNTTTTNTNDTVNNKPSTNPTSAAAAAMYNSCGSIGGISITVPVTADGCDGDVSGADYRDLDVLRRSLETCCQMMQKQQSTSGDQPPPVLPGGQVGLRSYVTSTTCSAVSSLANIGSPTSPPQATSPTDEVREILDQIRQLQPPTTPLPEMAPDPHQHQQPQPTKRPSSLHHQPPPQQQQHAKKKFFSKPNKAMYFPMVSNASARSMIKSPVSATTFLNRGRVRKGWISRSAPTTPGSGLPPNRLGDDSPLLIEHDEDQECEQNV